MSESDEALFARQRVIVLGLDGATFDIIEPMLQDEELPHFRQLIESGTSGRLLSTIPYATIPAWPSFMTGKNPGKHGVFDFFRDADGKREIINNRDIQAPTLWEILSAHGRHSIVVNVPGTFPPVNINGVVVSGMLTPSDAPFVSPVRAEALLDSASSGYRISSRADLSGQSLVTDIYSVAEKQTRAFLALLEHEPWQFSMLMVRAPDEIMHHFWEDRAAVHECYRYVDRVIGQIMESFPESAIVLVSDHGFQAQHKNFHVNKWLIDEGYMRIRKSSDLEASRWEEIGKLDGRGEQARSRRAELSLRPILGRIGVTKETLASRMPDRVRKRIKSLMPSRLVDLIPSTATPEYEVDWDRTRASAYQLFGMESKAIRVLGGESATARSICAELVGRLERLEDPFTGGPIVKRAYTVDELYEGPYADRAPDIVLDLHDGYNITNRLVADEVVTERDHLRGCHHREGILVASGPGVASDKRLDVSPNLVDVMPTLLHYVGLPVPDDSDGRVLKELFERGSTPYKREVSYEKRSRDELLSAPEPALRQEEQDEIEERLRSLGYL